jgi:hypothetical protein
VADQGKAVLPTSSVASGVPPSSFAAPRATTLLANREQAPVPGCTINKLRRSLVAGSTGPHTMEQMGIRTNQINCVVVVSWVPHANIFCGRRPTRPDTSISQSFFFYERPIEKIVTGLHANRRKNH